MKIAFLGTPEFAVAPLDGVARAGHEVVCVVAQPDRPAGRGQELREPATKVWARAHGIPVLQPEKVRDGRLARELAALRPDVLVVVAYGRILGEDLLTLAPLGAVNVHASLLPRWRGAAPIQWALAEGDRETGVTVMRMDVGLDTGDILLQRALTVAPGETSAALHDRLSALGAAALVEALPLLAEGRLVPVRQDGARATHARILEKEDGRLDFALPAARLAQRVRAFTPWPGAFTSLGGKLLKVHAARPLPEGAGLAPGEARAAAGGIAVGCGEGSALLLEEVQLEGKRRAAAAEFVKGQPLAAGTVLGR
ncbi:methionyl-tRNA formyltransferase [Anaeromyxobacter diazotrophicus]|uniref:Methionyl-tRNA formyltransferase n=1 Tax=Anaeromyxobacter diazotrophicus TaxID=2590199 RepID=A0A7I9VHD9_9BACT|nr:methionyl-tRNA formyltransferase [Anaeromyxobacter diazotrophicus]GEJ55801.1 methionyl-tRNA formyltransferase [Anaeromyxobacter diazotrophicus]